MSDGGRGGGRGGGRDGGSPYPQQGGVIIKVVYNIFNAQNIAVKQL